MSSQELTVVRSSGLSSLSRSASSGRVGFPRPEATLTVECTTGIPTVTWRIREGEDPGYTLFDLADRLRRDGWQVPAYTLTGTASDIAVQRILVRLGVSRDMAALLLDDFRDAVAHFTKHPVTVSMTKQESGGFSHL